MEVSTSSNSSLAVAAYAIQQQTVARSRDGDRDNERVDADRNAEARRGDNVSLSSEALRMSTQGSPDTSRNSVNPASASDTANRQQQQAARPEVARAESAATAAQALNAYRSASVL